MLINTGHRKVLSNAMNVYRWPRQYIYHHWVLGRVTPGCAFILSVCILMLPILELAAEHMESATGHLNPINQRHVYPHHKTLSCALLVIPSLNNVLPVMVLQSREVKMNMGGLSPHSSVLRFFPKLSAVLLRLNAAVGKKAEGVVVVLLLLMSGDIETNPGPLSLKDLKSLQNELYPVSHKWFSLGVQLEVPMETLQRIEMKHKQVDRPLLEMLTAWLKQTNPLPTWNILIETLASRPIGAGFLAQQLKDKHCPRQGVMGDCTSKTESPKHKLEESSQSVQHNLPRAEVKSKLDSAECQAFQKCFAVLNDGISDPGWFAVQLYSRDMISRDVRQEAELETLSASKQTRKILSAVEDQIIASPTSKFKDFLDILYSEPSLKHLARKLEEAYSSSTSPSALEEHRDSDSKCGERKKCVGTDERKDTFISPDLEKERVAGKSATQAEDHSTQPALLLPDTPLEKYALFLQSCYTKQFTSLKWPHLDDRKYINLAVISNEYANREELEKFKQQTIRGSIDDILERKAPIAMEDILKPNGLNGNSYPITQLLVEGAPGIGKSTFAWEVCQKWGQHQLFNEYSLVVLLKFQDKRLHEAMSVFDLFYHPNPKLQSEIIDYITITGGHGLLLILEGFDEAPASKRTMDSIFVRLFSGQELPKATVLLTTRPSASAWLRQLCRSKHSRRIEVVGFGKKEIDEYIQCAFSDEQSQLDFKEYLSLYPHIHSMMYVPLNSAIVSHVYESCKSSGIVVPKTMTQLYSSLVRALLLRYLKDKEEYKDTCTNINTFKDLPQPVYDQFCEICKIAYTGIMSAETELLFQDLPSDFDSLGLMQSCPELYVDRGASVSYNFLHFTFQEYLAAYYCFQKGETFSEKFIMEHITETKLQVVISFLSGLSMPNLSFWTNSEMEMVGNVPSSQGINIHFLHCLFESQVFISQGRKGAPYGECTVSQSITSWPQSTKSVTFCYNGVIMPSDFYVLGHCIAHSKCFWRIELYQLTGGDWLDAMLKGLNTKKTSGFIKEMEISYCELGNNMHQLLKLPLRHLTDLVLYHTQLTGSDLKCLNFSTFQKLKYLKLNNNNFQNGDLVQLIQSFSNSKSSLTELHLKRTGIGRADCEALGKLLEVDTCLQVLEVSNNYLDCESIQSIINNVPKSISLRKLRMSRSSPNKTTLLSLVTSECKLERLDIEACGLSGKDLCKFAEGIANSCTTLQYLSLSANLVNTSKCSRAISSMIRTNTKLRFLFLQDCKLQGDGVTEIASALEQNNTLESLDLSENKLNSEHIPKFTKKLKNSRLKRLAIQVDESVARLGDIFGQLVSAVRSHQYLMSFSLCASNLGNGGAQIIAEHLIASEHRLCNLLLDNCSIESDGAHHIAVALRENKSHLKFLLMSRNPIGWKGVVELVANSTSLHELDLRNTGTPQNQKEFTELTESLKKSNLKKLWLSEDCKLFPLIVEPQLQNIISFWFSDPKVAGYKYRSLLKKFLEGFMD